MIIESEGQGIMQSPLVWLLINVHSSIRIGLPCADYPVDIGLRNFCYEFVSKRYLCSW